MPGGTDWVPQTRDPKGEPSGSERINRTAVDSKNRFLKKASGSFVERVKGIEPSFRACLVNLGEF